MSSYPFPDLWQTLDKIAGQHAVHAQFLSREITGFAMDVRPQDRGTEGVDTLRQEGSQYAGQ